MIYGGRSTNLTTDSGDGNDVIMGGEGLNELDGLEHLDNDTDGADTIYGGVGDDDIRAELGADLAYGGIGRDFIDGETRLAADADNAADTLYGEDAIDTILGGGGADQINGGDGDDSLVGGDANDTIYGGNGGDTILGGDGIDSLYGEDGADSILGGAGNDSLFYNDYAGNNDSDNDTVWGDNPSQGTPPPADSHIGVFSGDVKDGERQ